MINAITSFFNNPIAIAVASVLVIVLGFFLKDWIKPWLQKAQDAFNLSNAEKQAEKSSDENQKMNDQVDKIFKP